jgi:hypothetical protein
MRNYIDAMKLNESWNVGELFQNLGSGSNWFLLDEVNELKGALSALNVKDHERFSLPAYVLVHDNRPIMAVSIDHQTGKVGHSALQGGAVPDAGWSRFTLALEEKLAGIDTQPMEESVEAVPLDECKDGTAFREKLLSIWVDRDPPANDINTRRPYGKSYWPTARKNGITLHTSPAKTHESSPVGQREVDGVGYIFANDDGEWFYNFEGKPNGQGMQATFGYLHDRYDWTGVEWLDQVSECNLPDTVEESISALSASLLEAADRMSIEGDYLQSLELRNVVAESKFATENEAHEMLREAHAALKID